MRLQVTPLEHISYVDSDLSRGEEPISVFCGDTLFVGECGKASRCVGLDRVVGFLEGSMFVWVTNGLPASHVSQLSIPELHDLTVGEKEIVIVDVRAPSEYDEFHIENAINIPLADLRTRYVELDPEAETVLICSTGHRSSTGTSILKQKGFKKVYNAAGEMTGFNAVDYGSVCPMCALSWAAAAGKRK